MSIRSLVLISTLVLSLSGCASAQWKPPAGRQKLAVASIVYPKAKQLHVGITIFGNSFDHDVDMGFDINREISQMLTEQLTKSGQYDLVDLPVDLKDFSYATSTYKGGVSFDSLPQPLAAQLVQDARGRGIDHIIVVVDSRLPPPQEDLGWGLYQHHAGCDSAYISYYIFVVNARTGATEVSMKSAPFRQVQDIAWDTAWVALPADNKAEIVAALRSIIHQDMPWTLTQLGIVPGNLEPADKQIAMCRPMA